MNEVHKAISAHSQKQHETVRKFLQLEAQREAFIEEAVQLCKANEPFNTTNINAVTKEINEMAKKGIVPVRKLVSENMVKEYVSRLSTK